MATNTHFTDTHGSRDGWTLAGVFFVFVLGSFTVLEIGLVPQNAKLVLLGLLFVGLPLLFGLINAMLGHPYSSSLAVGVSPIIAWILITIGRWVIGAIESSLVTLLVIAVGITAAGILAALGGFAIGYIGRITVDKYG